jgi:ribosomal protein S6--L-glutamate ligase
VNPGEQGGDERGEGSAAGVAPVPVPGAKRRLPRRRKKRPALGILSRKRSLYSTRRLCEAASAHGLAPRVLDVLACDLFVEAGALRLLHQGRELRVPEVVLPRIGASVTAQGLAVVRQLEACGARLLNGAAAIEASRDKLRALQRLAAGGVRVPRTVRLRGRGEAAALVSEVGGLPVILKLLQGTQGVGVMIASSLAEVESMVGALRGLGEELLLQEFVAEAGGSDVRALVVGGVVVGAMRRKARLGDFRSNLHRGGRGQACELTGTLEAAAVQAAQALGLSVAGVDLLESARGPLVLEVNSSPGFEGLEKATGRDVAGAIVQSALRLLE